MDEQRFEELSKKLATTVSRRQAVRILGATAVGGLGALFGARGAFAHHNARCRDFGDNCRSNAECCTGVCMDFHCACPSGAVICGDECVAECPPPQILNPQTCQCECNPAIVCGPFQMVDPQTCECVCVPGTLTCGQNACCTPGQVCRNGTCVNTVPCGPTQCPVDQLCCASAFGFLQCCGPGQACNPIVGCV
jgi:hypothetical protein